VNKRYAIIVILLISLFTGIACLCYLYNKRDLNREILTASLNLGRGYLINNQTDAGNFNYEYDFIARRLKSGDSQVRQAGALWGISLIHRYMPSEETYNACKKGFRFFDSVSVRIKDSSRLIAYPNEGTGNTGAIALVCLAYIEVLQTDLDRAERAYLEDNLKSYFNFLLSLRRQDGLFYESYDLKSGRPSGEPSPYYDGEGLLAMVKAANYAGFTGLKEEILKSAEAMYNRYVIEAGKKERDSDLTKGFYQWGSMSFYEIFHAGWGNEYAYRTIDLARWMVFTHGVLFRQRNSGYAYEGIISAYQCAKELKDKGSQGIFGFIIDRGLTRLTGWQVGGPAQNGYLKNNPSEDPVALGGVMNCKDCPVLRIDVTQHQMHAVILALAYVY
jgi:hypothetical protein